MARGDIKKGGNADDLVIEVASTNTTDLSVGDAVVLSGSYEVRLSRDVGRRIFGQVTFVNPGTREIQVRYRGLCTFTYDGPAPFVDGKKGVEVSTRESESTGRVQSPSIDAGAGIVIGVDTTAKTVDVIL